LEREVVQEAKGRKGERKLENCCKVFFVLVIEILLHILVESVETESRQGRELDVIHMRLVEDCSFAADKLLQRVIDLLCCCGDQRGLKSKIEKE
jgi:hypothetical protein